MELYELSIQEAFEKLSAREISSVELTEAVLKRIDAVDGKVEAYLTVMRDYAMEQARKADKRLASGEGVTPLTGIPLGIKDLICVKGVENTCASKILQGFKPPYDATVITRLKAAGAVFVGKLNMDEFAMGSTNETSAFRLTKNPWNLNCSPGGSSGGCSAALAARMCLGALGSDTGGSIRQPASHCGVVGLKPTYGRVSRYGAVAFGSSLDQIGPMTRNVGDCALLLNAIAGYDPMDSTSAPVEMPDYVKTLSADNLKGLRIGLPKEYYATDGLDADVKAAVERALSTLKDLGAKLVDISLPHTEYAVAAYYVLAPAEASANLEKFDGVRYGYRTKNYENLVEMYANSRSEGFGPEVQRRIIIGTYCLASGYYDAYYGKASQVRSLIINDFEQAFEQCDIIVAPVAPKTAPLLGHAMDNLLGMYLADIFTISTNLAGIPGLSLPCGFSGANMPIGLQLMGPHFQEDVLLQVGSAFERATKGIYNQKAPL